MFAGQITGVEGYVESTASGALAAMELARRLEGKEPINFPRETAMGAMAPLHQRPECGKLSTDECEFRPDPAPGLPGQGQAQQERRAVQAGAGGAGGAGALLTGPLETSGRDRS